MTSANTATAASTRSLPLAEPASQNTDSRRISAFLDALESAPGVTPHSLMILRHGHVLAQGWWAPYTPDHRQLLYSLSKSFTSTAAAFACAEGLLRLDDPVVSYFPEFEAEITDPGSRSILVRHLLAMASGHSADQWEKARSLDPLDPVRGFLLTGPDGEPGSVFAYNQPCTYTVGAIVQRASGQRLVDYLRPRLFDPLGIGDVAWQQYRPGRDLCFSGLHAATDAIARLGQLYLQRGVWEGVRLLPEGWVEQATRPQVDNAGGDAGPDWQQGYGFQFWMSRHGYRGDGAFGQYCLVLPEQDAVIAITSETIDMGSVLDLVWEHLLPAFDEGPATDAEIAAQADAALARRLARLAIAPRGGSAGSVPADGIVCAAAGDGWFSEVRLEQCPDGSGDVLATLTESASHEQRAGYEALEPGPIALRFTPGGGWHTAEPGEQPTAVSGGWTDRDTLSFDVLFLETPHRLGVTCDLAQRSVDAEFHTRSLIEAPIAHLRAPLS